MISSQGTNVRWGSLSLGTVTSLSVSQSASDIDMTSMSSRYLTDPLNTSRKLVIRDYDSGDCGPVDVAIEFVASTNNFATVSPGTPTAWVGLSRTMSFSMPSGIGPEVGVNVTVTALLTQFSLSASVGDYVRGSANFRLSGL